MTRDSTALQGRMFDLLVVGGGIHGACTAWEAALRGLQVALIEARDFGSGTSGNSLRTLHGGLRYLQHLDFARMRESIRERREWLRLAPHLSRPMRFVMPTTGWGIKGPLVLRAALLANDLISADRNQGVTAANRLPAGDVWSAARTAALLEGTQVSGFNGAAVWYDGVCTDSERLLWEVVQSATCSGARACNYLEAVELRTAAGRVRGVRAIDRLDGREVEIQAQMVVNATGPWVDGWLPPPARGAHGRLFEASRAFNLLTRPLPFGDAVGLPVPRRSRDTDAIFNKGTNTYFILPWNGASLVGTRHLRCDPANRDSRVPDAEVREFIAELNAMLGAHRLRGEDIIGVYSGLLPEVRGSTGEEVVLDKSARILDHGEEQGIEGLFSVLGVKWTTARLLGERAALAAARQLGRPVREVPERRLSGLREDVLEALLRQLPESAAPLAPGSSVSAARALYAARYEMAVRLSDVVMRRLPLSQNPDVGRDTLLRAAEWMAREAGWSAQRQELEIEACARELATFRGDLKDLP